MRAFFEAKKYGIPVEVAITLIPENEGRIDCFSVTRTKTLSEPDRPNTQERRD
jgi:hypothetical protein